jgi:hypothetical protein
MLPESKGDFPKALYLDQNKWIDLARAHYGKPGGEPFEAALQAVRRATELARLVVPVSVVNVVEATAHHDSERRERLARFMVELSGNLAMQPHMAVFPWEVKNAVRAFFTEKQLLRIRSSLVRRGVQHAFGKQMRIAGLSPSDEAAALEAMNHPDIAVELLLKEGDARELSEQARKGDEETAAMCERVRARSAAASLTPEQRFGVELAEYFSDGVGQRALQESCEEAGITVTGFFEQLIERGTMKEFFQRIHSLHVLLSLTVARDKDQVRPIHRNDHKDVMGLAVALPYCNLVVSENHWGHMAKTLKFDQQFDTVLLTDARALPEELQRLGCL